MDASGLSAKDVKTAPDDILQLRLISNCSRCSRRGHSVEKKAQLVLGPSLHRSPDLLKRNRYTRDSGCRGNLGGFILSTTVPSGSHLEALSVWNKTFDGRKNAVSKNNNR